MTRDKVVADTEAEIMMTDAVADMEVAETTIEATEESAATVMMTVDMLPVELIATAGMIDTDVEEMSDEVVATTTAMIEVATVMVADLVKLLPLRVPMVTQLLAERAGSHMPEVEETLMTDTVVISDR
jgi:hypothetical protein